MPGICSFFWKEPEPEEASRARIEAMLARMTWDPAFERVLAVAPGAAIGCTHRRSRLNAAAIAQDPSGRHTIVLDGHVVGAEALASESAWRPGPGGTDAQRVLAAFLAIGPDLIPRLNGIFAGAILDRLERTITVFADRGGYRVLYIHEDDRRFIAAAEMKALFVEGDIPASVDEDAICDLHNFHAIQGDATLIREVRLFPRAAVWTIGPRTDDRRVVWDYPLEIEPSRASEDELCEEGAARIRTGLDHVIRRPSRIAVSLSGGLDSRLFAGLAASMEVGADAVHYGHPTWYETAIARRIARAAGIPFTLYDLLDEDLPEAFLRGIETSDGQVSSDQFFALGSVARVYRDAPETVLIDGLTIDVLFQPAFLFLPGPMGPPPADLVAWLAERHRFGYDGLFRRVLAPAFARRVCERAREAIAEGIEGDPARHPLEVSQRLYFANRGRRYVASAHRVLERYGEYVFPGADLDLFDFGLCIPVEMRAGGRLYRRIIARLFPALAAIPHPKTHRPILEGSSLGARVRAAAYRPLYIARRLIGGAFDPINPVIALDARYRREPAFRRFVRETLASPAALSRGYYGRRGIEWILHEQQRGQDFIHVIHTLMTVELFHRHLRDVLLAPSPARHGDVVPARSSS
ncbi:MAG: hypothetical protein JXP34_16495 [Planctomycetes bacterium]|nr:hypothetical protein [Planctomycetota bacterium]